MNFQKRDVIWIVLAVACVLSFQNCGKGFGVDSSDLASLGTLRFVPGSCEIALENLYRRTYFSTVTQKCASCHTNGPGVGSFGSSQFSTSYTEFRRLGRAAIERNLVNPGHQPPWTGPVNQGIVDRYKPMWDEAEPAYEECLMAEGGGSGVSAIYTSGISDPRIIQRQTNQNTFTTLEWDLSTNIKGEAFQNQVSGILSVQVRVAVLAAGLKGYEFRNPSLRLKSANDPKVAVGGLRVILNGQVQSQVTTYLQAGGAAESTTAVNLAPNAAYALLVLPEIAETDEFAFAITDIILADGSRLGGGQPSVVIPGAPGEVPADPTPVVAPTFAELIGNDSSKNVFRRHCLSCHSSNNPQGGLNMSSYSVSRANATLIVSRMNSLAAPMPTTGLAPARDRELVEAWVKAGAPQ